MALHVNFAAVSQDFGYPVVRVPKAGGLDGFGGGAHALTPRGTTA